MEIVPRQVFRDARSVPARFSRYDPRSDNFNEPEVIVDLRDCTSVHAPAVLWCAVYLLLAKRRGSDCVLIPPDDVTVAPHCMDLGLFRILQQEGVSVEQQHSITSTSRILLPLTRFSSTNEAEDLTNQIHHSLIESKQGSASIFHVIYETFSELANNAAEHSTSEIGAYALVLLDTSEGNNRLVCGVADGGIGIQTSLLRNPSHEEYGHYEWAAMDRATEELVSGTLDSFRGIGLYETVEKMRIPGRELIIHSGTGIISKGVKLTTRITSTRLFPGTMVYISIPT
jgi:hypothetical protein